MNFNACLETYNYLNHIICIFNCSTKKIALVFPKVSQVAPLIAIRGAMRLYFEIYTRYSGVGDEGQQKKVFINLKVVLKLTLEILGLKGAIIF